MDRSPDTNTDAAPNPRQNSQPNSAESASSSQRMQHLYDNITVSNNSCGVFGDIVAQNVNLVLNGEAQDTLRTMISKIMADLVPLRRQHKISKPRKRSSHRRQETITMNPEADIITLSDVKKTLEVSDLSTVASSCLPSQAERMFTRGLLLQLGIYRSTRVHQIDDLPFMRIALRMARAIDAYLANWIMTEADREIYREGDLSILKQALYNPHDILICRQQVPDMAVQDFEPIRDQLSPYTLVELLQALQTELRKSPERVRYVARLSEHVLGLNHPVTFICYTSLAGKAFPAWYDIILHYLCNWVGRLVLEYGIRSEVDDDGGVFGPVLMYGRILDIPDRARSFSDMTLHASCLRDAVIQCSLIYRDDGVAINALKLYQGLFAQKSGDTLKAIEVTREIYDKIDTREGSLSLQVKANAAYKLGEVLSHQYREEEASRAYLAAIELYHKCPREDCEYLERALHELHYLKSTYGGRDALEGLLAQYPEYWTRSQDGYPVLQNLDFLPDFASSDSGAASDADSEIESEGGPLHGSPECDDHEMLSEPSEDYQESQ